METTKRPHRQLLACVCLVAALFATPSQAANILAFGDSITEGYGSNEGGYPAKLNNLLNANNKPSTVFNEGLGGEDTYHGVYRFDSVLSAHPAEMVLLMEGTNDVVEGIPVYTTQYNLQAMINATKAAGKTPVLATLAPSDRSDVASPIADLWNPMIRTLANSNSLRLADQGAALSPVWGAATLGDGLHPNDYGYQVIANTWYSAIASMISSTGSASTSSGSGKGGGGGCFIATAAYGSPMASQVMTLRNFRDQHLITNSLGQGFVSFYYHYSPPVANFIKEHEILKPLVRSMIAPLVNLCSIYEATGIDGVATP